MNKLILLTLVLITITSCQQEKKDTAPIADAVSSAAAASSAAQDNLDFEKKDKDESCSTEEDLEKQIEKAKKEPKAFKLQGGDPGCSTD